MSGVLTIEQPTLRKICERLDEIIDSDTDSVYVFRQRATCWDDVGIHGQANVTEEPLCWAVL